MSIYLTTPAWRSTAYVRLFDPFSSILEIIGFSTPCSQRKLLCGCFAYQDPQKLLLGSFFQFAAQEQYQYDSVFASDAYYRPVKQSDLAILKSL